MKIHLPKYNFVRPISGCPPPFVKKSPSPYDAKLSKLGTQDENCLEIWDQVLPKYSLEIIDEG